MPVVNIKVANIRPKYKNLKEWMQDPNNIYIARANIVFIDKQRYPKENSYWANPYKVGKDGTREEVIKKYEKYITSKIDIKTKILELKNKNLGCWCYPLPCHGDVLIKLIKKYSN